jgi:trafficking protein particle complex subunit 6
MIATAALDYLLIATSTEMSPQALDQMGFKVGFALAEKMTREKARFVDNLEIVKYICKEFWIFCFQKQIDNLKTNHRGVYVLCDNSFRWISKMSSDKIPQDQLGLFYARELAFPCGILRGACSNLGTLRA